jgi:hypothetical protein
MQFSSQEPLNRTVKILNFVFYFCYVAHLTHLHVS